MEPIFWKFVVNILTKIGHVLVYWKSKRVVFKALGGRLIIREDILWQNILQSLEATRLCVKISETLFLVRVSSPYNTIFIMLMVIRNKRVNLAHHHQHFPLSLYTNYEGTLSLLLMGYCDMIYHQIRIYWNIYQNEQWWFRICWEITNLLFWYYILLSWYEISIVKTYYLKWSAQSSKHWTSGILPSLLSNLSVIGKWKSHGLESLEILRYGVVCDKLVFNHPYFLDNYYVCLVSVSIAVYLYKTQQTCLDIFTMALRIIKVFPINKRYHIYQLWSKYMTFYGVTSPNELDSSCGITVHTWCIFDSVSMLVRKSRDPDLLRTISPWVLHI